MLGCVYLIASVVVFSSQVVLQAITLRDFPAPMSLCALTSVIGVLITVVVQMVEDEGWEGIQSLTIQEMIAYSTLAGSVSGMCVSFNSWAMKKRGPVVVSIFNPLATVISAIFSLLTFGESISVGR
ncbi:UNVERIFIED_CONTAM: WAT1-related protein [Sesamum radiatum]|uniref:WAT1-related protein n=1 Tax=Sesamum radiatum TaxID=300843 RepID=A0AAW2MDE6_SESRA